MKMDPNIAAPAAGRASSRLPIAALAVGGALLAFGAVRFLIFAARAVHFPYELDYGEGIVWQQMLLMFGGKGYGPIDGFPAIVFHYPPFFHALVEGLAAATGMDALAMGRLVSIAATLCCACFAGLIAARLVGDDASPAARICGGFVGLVSLNFVPVTVWAPLMRVDMVAMALSLAGVWFGLRALERRGFVYAASFCFVAAVFTKQTAIAAPAATFLTLLIVRPATAWRGIAASVVLGLAAVAGLTLATDGGFLRHILLYNINRFDLTRLSWIPQQMGFQILFVGIALFGLFRGLGERRGPYAALPSWAARREALRTRPGDAAFLLLIFYFAAATLMLGLVAKSGSNINYFIEWMIITGLFTALAVRDAAAAAAGPGPLRTSLPALLLPPLLGFQIFTLPALPPYAISMDPARVPALEKLSAAVRASTKPVISDDMVLLLRNGKAVQWEPAIFAELASKGVWNERPFAARIRARQFAFFVTVGDRGDRLFDSRYTPAVADAMDAAYPVRHRMAGYVLHLPAADR